MFSAEIHLREPSGAGRRIRATAEITIVGVPVAVSLIRKSQLQIQRHSALADVPVAAERFCMLTAHDLNWRGHGFVDVFG